jgi:DNA-binding CsgD family transcriptional regulator
MSGRTVSRRNTFLEIRRICYAGLPSVPLRRRIGDVLGSAVPSDGFTFATTDPDTGMLTHAVSEGIPRSLFDAWIDHLYPYHVAAEVLDMAREGPRVTNDCSHVTREVLQPAGMAFDLRSVLSEEGHPLGFLCLLRDRGDRDFNPDELAFLRRLSPHLLHGLRTAALLDKSRSEDPRPPSDGPGVVVMDPKGHIVTLNASARSHFHDLRDLGPGPDPVPSAVASVVSQLVHLHRSLGDQPSSPLHAQLATRGHSGRWYRVQASLSEPDALGDATTLIVIEGAGPRQTAAVLTRLYGLTPREREVLTLAAKGFSTKKIARHLGISPYTVQEHIGNACTRVGVRSRKALLAQLFFDGYAEGLRA